MYKKIVSLIVVFYMTAAVPWYPVFSLAPPGLQQQVDENYILLQKLTSTRPIELPMTNIVPVITPLKLDGSIDEQAIVRYVRHLKFLGVKAMLVMGATGEFDKLDNNERLKAIRLFAREAKRHDIMVFAHATGDRDKPRQTIDNIKEIENIAKEKDKRIDAVVIAPLYYLTLNDDIKPHIVDICREVDKLTLPLMLYNNPHMAKDKGVNIDKEKVEELRPYIASVKDSSGDMQVTLGYIDACDAVYVGNEDDVLDSINWGARGSVGSSGSILRIFNRIINGEKDSIEMQTLFTDRIREKLTVNLTKIPAGIKYVLSLMGICSDIPAPGNEKLSLKEQQDVADAIFNRYFLEDFIDALVEEADKENNLEHTGNVLISLIKLSGRHREGRINRVNDILQRLIVSPKKIGFTDTAIRRCL